MAKAYALRARLSLSMAMGLYPRFRLRSVISGAVTVRSQQLVANSGLSTSRKLDTYLLVVDNFELV